MDMPFTGTVPSDVADVATASCGMTGRKTEKDVVSEGTPRQHLDGDTGQDCCPSVEIIRPPARDTSSRRCEKNHQLRDEAAVPSLMSGTGLMPARTPRGASWLDFESPDGLFSLFCKVDRQTEMNGDRFKLTPDMVLKPVRH